MRGKGVRQAKRCGKQLSPPLQGGVGGGLGPGDTAPPALLPPYHQASTHPQPLHFREGSYLRLKLPRATPAPSASSATGASHKGSVAPLSGGLYVT